MRIDFEILRFFKTKNTRNKPIFIKLSHSKEGETYVKMKKQPQIHWQGIFQKRSSGKNI